MFDLDGLIMMIVGPDTAARLLEIGYVETPDADIIVHAMAARAKFLR